MLCSIAIIKNGDKNLVDGRTQFNVKSEIFSLDFRVDLKSSYICKSCLGKLKKRRALLSNLRDVNASLRQIYSSSSNGASSEESDTRMTTKTCSRALFEKRCSACEACCIAGWTIARTSSGLRQNSTHDIYSVQGTRRTRD